MDATAWVAIAGIAGTVLAPLVLERMRRESARREHLLRHRLDVYAGLLEVTARLADNAMEWSSIPLAQLKETDEEKLDTLMARVHVLGSPEVFALVKATRKATGEFNRRLMFARLHAARVEDEGQVDDAKSMGSRMSAGEMADAIRGLHLRLESTIRAELHAPTKSRAARWARLLRKAIAGRA